MPGVETVEVGVRVVGWERGVERQMKLGGQERAGAVCGRRTWFARGQEREIK